MNKLEKVLSLHEGETLAGLKEAYELQFYVVLPKEGAQRISIWAAQGGSVWGRLTVSLSLTEAYRNSSKDEREQLILGSVVRECTSLSGETYFSATAAGKTATSLKTEADLVL